MDLIAAFCLLFCSFIMVFTPRRFPGKADRFLDFLSGVLFTFGVVGMIDYFIK